MNTFQLLLDGFATALTPMNLLYAVIGVVLGTAVGVLPGIGPAMTVALLLPLTYDLEPTSAFIMFAGIFYGGMYGGSTTSILLNTPGESSSVVTAIEGNKMAKAGRAAQALATAAIGSFVAGTIGTALLVATAPLIVKVAVNIGAEDYFAIMVLAFIAVTAVLGASRVRGFASLALGLMIGLVGIDATTGQQRMTFGLPLLADGIDVVVVAVGIFAVGEALWVAAHLRRTPAQIIPVGRAWMGKEDWKRCWMPWLRGTAFGFPFGALPAGGAEIPTFLSYVTEKKLSKHPEEFGHGAIEGVAGPEATNNASAAGTLVPMLALGLPVSATSAVMLAAFQTYGIQPGPLLFDREPELVWGLIASLFIGNTLLLVLNLPLAPFWAKLLSIPRPYLYAGILFFASLGAYAVNAQAFDLVLLLVLGALGFAMRRFGLPVLPAIIGVILGPRAELQLRRALQISDGQAAVSARTTPRSSRARRRRAGAGNPARQGRALMARSYLFAPGHSAKLLDRVFTAGADAAMLDLEDAVPPDAKATARRMVADVLGDAPPDVPAWVRVNAARTDWCAADLDAVGERAYGIRIPKAESAADVAWVAERVPGKPIICAIESARGVLAAQEIAAAPGVAYLAMGGVDLQQDLNTTGGNAQTLYVRSYLVIVSRAAGLEPPIDSVYPRLDDESGLHEQAEFAKSLGFSGKSAIHPRQLPVLHRVFTPTQREIAWAREVVEAFEAAGGAGLRLPSGEFVDLPVARRARRVLDVAASLSESARA